MDNYHATNLRKHEYTPSIKQLTSEEHFNVQHLVMKKKHRHTTTAISQPSPRALHIPTPKSSRHAINTMYDDAVHANEESRHWTRSILLSWNTPNEETIITPMYEFHHTSSSYTSTTPSFNTTFE